MASSTSHRWFASIIRWRSGPISCADQPDAPRVVGRIGADLDLEVREAVGDAPRGRGGGPCRRSSPSSPADVRVGGIAVAQEDGLAVALCRLLPLENRQRLVLRQRVGDVAGSRSHATICCGVMSASSFHSGLPACLACRSHIALTMAAIAMWMTPFSGPSQRSCESPASDRQNAAEVGEDLVDVAADDQRREARGSPRRRPRCRGRS